MILQRSSFFVLFGLLLALFVTSCSVVPITGRRSLSLVSDAEVLAMSRSQYSSFISQAHSKGLIMRDARVTGIAQRLVNATDSYMRSEGMQSLLSTMQWELNVVGSSQINAFCMPGGKIVVYTGLVSMLGGQSAQTDAELATVLGHEIAHALARHASERISRSMMQSYGGQILGSVLGIGGGSSLGMVFSQLYGLGSTMFISRPFERKQEYEADKMGLVLMALAGYDPRYAVTLWRKMEKASGGNRNEFLSTHPSEANRIKAIQEYLPTALKYYQGTLQVGVGTMTRTQVRSERTIRASDLGKRR